MQILLRLGRGSAGAKVTRSGRSEPGPRERFSALARQAGSPLAVNMVLLGALAATEYLPLAAADLLSVIRTRTKEKFVAANLRAFELGAAAARDPGNWRRPEA